MNDLRHRKPNDGEKTAESTASSLRLLSRIRAVIDRDRTRSYFIIRKLVFISFILFYIYLIIKNIFV